MLSEVILKAHAAHRHSRNLSFLYIIYHKYHFLPSGVYLCTILGYNVFVYFINRRNYLYNEKQFLKGLLIKITSAVSATVLVFSAFAADTQAAAYNKVYSETDTTSTKAVWPDAPDVNSNSCILIDADTGSILFERNSHEKCYPASTTKILTGLLTIENCNMDDVVTFSQSAANSINVYEDANLSSKAGEQFTVNQLLHGLLLYSANEMAYALGEHVAGSIDAFVDMMNAKAKELGALNTHFANASGLYNTDHYTTAYDMAMIARGCYNNASFVSIDSTADAYVIPATNMSAQRTIRHRHKMLKGRAYYYEYCKGGKQDILMNHRIHLLHLQKKTVCVLYALYLRKPQMR